MEHADQWLRVQDGDVSFELRAVSRLERWRAETFFEKEAGTIAWLKGSLRQGDVFLDVGANVGIYSILASALVGASGSVISVEPHLVNASCLIGNVVRNNAGNVRVLSSALHEADGWFDFNYYSTESGSAMSQLGNTRDADEKEFKPACVESKFATTVDSLIASRQIASPDLIKVDVDGNELLVLRGMRSLFTGAKPPRSVQVEINPRFDQGIFDYMRSCGFEMRDKHYSDSGAKKLSSGISPELVSFNAIFSLAGRGGEK